MFGNLDFEWTRAFVFHKYLIVLLKVFIEVLLSYYHIAARSLAYVHIIIYPATAARRVTRVSQK